MLILLNHLAAISCTHIKQLFSFLLTVYQKRENHWTSSMFTGKTKQWYSALYIVSLHDKIPYKQFFSNNLEKRLEIFHCYIIICKYILNVNNNKMRHIALKLKDVKTGLQVSWQVLREEEKTKERPVFLLLLLTMVLLLLNDIASLWEWHFQE